MGSVAKATLLWVTVGFLAAASTLYDAQQTRQSTVGHRPALEPAHAAVVRVSGHVERSGSGGYWVRLSDFAGKVGGRAEGVLGDNPSEHRFDLDGAPTDRSDTLEVWAGKSEGWEGYLNLVVTIDGRFVGCADTSAGDPAVAEAYASHRLGTRPQPGSEECRLYLWYA
jgi:hypothetical protein